MAFRDFSFPKVLDDLGLSLQEADLYSTIGPLPLRPEFASALAQDARLALAVNTEKARSEFIIAPSSWKVRMLLPT